MKNTTIYSPKIPPKFICEKCDYSCYKKGDFNKHFVLNTFKRYLKKAPNHLCLGNPFTNKSCFSLKKQAFPLILLVFHWMCKYL